MDPLSISVSCITLITTITQVSVAVTNFVREVRDARGDLDAISRELVSLKSVLELLAEDTEGPHSATLPERLKDQILDILKNCKHVVTEVETSLKRHSASRFGRAGHWAVGGGKDDMMKFRSSLETHKTALGLTLDMVAITITRDIKDDTQEIRKDTATIKDDTVLILEQIAQLQAQLPQNIMKDTSNHMLHRYLEDLSNFAELMSNPPEHEPEALTAVNSEDEEKPACSPPSVYKDSEISHRRPSSLLREMYIEAYGTSTSRKSVQHIPGVPSISPTQGNTLHPTGASATGTLDKPLTTRQDGPSQSNPVKNPRKIPEARPTVHHDDLPRLPQSHRIPPVQHQVQKPKTIPRSLHSPWTNPNPLTLPTENNIPRVRSFPAVSTYSGARASHDVPNPKPQPSTSSAEFPGGSTREKGATRSSTDAQESLDKSPREKDRDRQLPAPSTKGTRASHTAEATAGPRTLARTASVAKPVRSKGSASSEDTDRHSPVPAAAPGNRVRVVRTGGAASWGFWGQGSKKASS